MSSDTRDPGHATCVMPRTDGSGVSDDGEPGQFHQVTPPDHDQITRQITHDQRGTAMFPADSHSMRQMHAADMHTAHQKRTTGTVVGADEQRWYRSLVAKLSVRDLLPKRPDTTPVARLSGATCSRPPDSPCSTRRRVSVSRSEAGIEVGPRRGNRRAHLVRLDADRLTGTSPRIRRARPSVGWWCRRSSPRCH